MTKDMVEQLNYRFDLGQHEARKGGAGQWFVYLKKQAIIERLDTAAPMDWQTKIVSSLRTDDRVEVIMEMTVAGMTRSYDGVAEDNRNKSGTLFPLNTAKAATTDAFKRVASMFGVGLYLRDCPIIKATNEKDALRQFASWFNRQSPTAPTPPPQQPAPESNGQAPTVTAWPVDRIDKLFAHWIKQGLSESDILRFAGVVDKYSEQWNKYASNQDASGAIQRAHNAEMDGGNTSNMPDNTEHSATFTHMMYVGKYSNMQFATKPDGSDNNTYAICYGGRGAIKKWNAELYEQLQLNQFDAIKGKNIVSDFVKMVVPVDFRFVSEGKGDDAYFKVVGIVGDPVIPY